jgi:hypothetical protein
LKDALTTRMPTLCLFCDNNSGNREHLWPKWIHERKKFGPLRHKVGNRPEKIVGNPQQKIKTVCSVCNNGWMSQLEDENIPIIGCMFADVAIPLDEGQQSLVSAWAVKTAMVVDSIQGRDLSRRFYKRDECVSMRLYRTIPPRTRIWIGHSALSALSAIGTLVGAFNADRTAKMPGMVVNIVVGHLAIQVFSFRVEPEDPSIKDPEPKPGNWEDLLMPIWPTWRNALTWPPKATFTNRVGPYPIALLMDRWRIGQEVPLPYSD